MKYFKNLFSFLSSFLIFGLPTGSSRKYDIEAECQKLYGEDLQSVLKRFRKSSEYLVILESKLDEFKMNLDYIASNVQTYYEYKMSEKVEELVGANHTYIEEGNRKFMRDRYPLFRRQSDITTTPSTNLTGIERLDSYRMLQTSLSVDERNKFKDLGFEFAGHIVHSMITAASGDEAAHPSTLLPYSNDDPKKGTAHHHEVTHESTTLGEENDTNTGTHPLHTHPPENYRNYQSNNIL